MAVNITKKFWNGSEYKDIAKIVFTSPNFTSPAIAGTRSHMPPGGIYMGTWFEAVDFMYRQKPNQDYADLSKEIESFFGKVYITEMFDFATDTTVSGYHLYGDDYLLGESSVLDGYNFIGLSQGYKEWKDITVTDDGNIYACVNSGDIYKQSVNTGDFISLGQTARAWYGIVAAPGGNVYACVNSGDIYKQIGGVGQFSALSQTARAWYGMAASITGDVYATVYGGDIYKQTNGTGDFISLNQSNRNWTGITVSSNGDVYATVYGGDIYKQTNGGNTFIPLGQSSRNWVGITASNLGDIYATVSYGDIYKQVGGKGTFIPLGQTHRYWRGISASLDGSIYACSNDDIYIKNSGNGYSNVLYKDKNNYGIIGDVVSTTSSVIDGVGKVTNVSITFSETVGSGVVNEWMLYTTSGILTTSVSGIAAPVGEITSLLFTDSYTVVVNNPENTSFNDIITNNISGTLSGIANEEVTGVFNGSIATNFTKDVIVSGIAYTIGTTVSGAITGTLTGHNYGTASGVVDTLISGTMPFVDDTILIDLNSMVTAYTGDSRYVTISGMVTGILSGTVTSGVDYPLVSGTISGNVTGDLEGVYNNELVCSTVTGTMVVPILGFENEQFTTVASGSVYGAVCSVISGTVDSLFSGSYIEPIEFMYHQYSNVAIDSETTLPKSRWHHGGNSIIFTVTFGEAYDCRLTAWDDDTHSTTLNKVINEEHYRVDAVAYRSNISDSAHAPVFRESNNLVYPPVYDIPLKGNEKYYGDFDLIFAIEDSNYGEYLAFIPRLVNMDDSFIAGSYDFITTLHYQYT